MSNSISFYNNVGNTTTAHVLDDGVTVQQFLNTQGFGQTASRYTIRLNGSKINPSDFSSYTLKNGDRLTLAPGKVEGARS